VTASPSGDAAGLRPLLLFAGGVFLGDALGLASGSVPARPSLVLVAAVLGLAALFSGLRRRPAAGLLLLAAGTSMGLAAGSGQAAERAALLRDVPPGTTARVRIRILDGWSPSRWGTRTRVAMEQAVVKGRSLDLPHHARLEIRGTVWTHRLPGPGSVVEGLAVVRPGRAPADDPVLVVRDPRLLTVVAPPTGLPAVRQRLANRLLEAGGTSVRTLRAAELAAAVGLGRRDMLPAGRTSRWRDSGLAHVLAVSGLHVGVLAALVWATGTLLRLPPAPRRILVLLLAPAYALLAGAAPPAIRAAFMIDAYLLARLLGRHVTALATVALAAAAMLLAAPAILLRAGFQLTILVTAALVRWVPPLSRRLPLPRRLATATAVPLVAWLAALPLVATWFGRIVPGAVLTNLAGLAAVPALLVLALAGIGLAAAWPPAATPLLAAIDVISRHLLAVGAPARRHPVPIPHLPPAAVVAGGCLLILAVLPGRPGRGGLTVAAIVLPALLFLAPSGARRSPPAVTLLPVADGTAVLLRTAEGSILVDGGRRDLEAVRFLRDARVDSLRAVVATHTDTDHTGGLDAVLRGCRVRCLLLPRWMTADPAAAGLLRTARRSGITVIPLARGLAVSFGTTRLETLWPPALRPPDRENDRSLVLRASLGDASVLLPADTTRRVEPRYAVPPPLAGLLVVPHHGSRSSCSSLLIHRVRPSAALVPAGPASPFHHPAPGTLRRLRRAHVPYLVSRWTPWCGASADTRGRWRLEP